MSDEPLIAVFIDFENLAIGVRHMRAGKFQIQLILKRLLEKGRIVFKRAYCDCDLPPSNESIARAIILATGRNRRRPSATSLIFVVAALMLIVRPMTPT